MQARIIAKCVPQALKAIAGPKWSHPSHRQTETVGVLLTAELLQMSFKKI